MYLRGGDETLGYGKPLISKKERGKLEERWDRARFGGQQVIWLSQSHFAKYTGSDFYGDKLQKEDGGSGRFTWEGLKKGVNTDWGKILYHSQGLELAAG